MKVSIESVAASYRNTTQVDAKNKQSVPLKDTGKSFDQIMIHTNSKQLSEGRITEAAEKSVQRSVFQKTPEEKIAALKEQISQGTYQPDAEALASRILFLGGYQ